MIKNCRSCNSKKLTDILSMGTQYLSDFIGVGEDKPPSYPLNLVLCLECELLQLKETTPSSAMYHDRYGYYSGVNNTMREHLKGIVESAVKRVSLAPQDVVIDIGSNDATLLKNYPDSLVRIGFDPVSKFAERYNEQNLLFANHYFDGDIFYQIVDRPAKVITAISMFYDLDNPNEFVNHLKNCLAPDGLLIIQQNYVAGMISQLAFDNICHEHLEYYSLSSLTKLLNRHFLEVVEVEENDLNGGSFRVYVKHMDSVKKMRLKEQKMRLGNPATYLLFSFKVQNTVSKIRKFIKGEVLKGKSIYVYGASTRGNTLLQACKLDSTLISAAVERNPEKWGKLYAGTDIPIISEEQARSEKPDYFLVLPWFFSKEIIKREGEYIKQGGALIFPMPEFYVVNHENFSNFSDS